MKFFFAFVLLFGVVYSANIERYGRDVFEPVYHPVHYDVGHEIDKVMPVISHVGLVGEKVLHHPIEHARMIVPEMTDMSLLGCKLYYPIVYYDDGMRYRRQVYIPKRPCCHMEGGFVAGEESDKLAASQIGVSSVAAQGSAGYIKGTSSSTSSSSASSSESNKATKIKSQSQFGAGNSNFAAQQQGALQSSSLGLTTAGAGWGGAGWGGLGGGVVGVNQNQQSGMYGHSLAANTDYLAGSSNTEVEQSESNKQSASEAHHASQNNYEGAGAQFAAQGQSATQQQLNRDRNSGYVGVRQPGYYNPGGLVAAGSSDRLKASSTSLTSGSAEGSAGYIKGTSSQASSEKSSSSENNKATKIKSNSNIAAGNQNLQAQGFGATQSSDFKAVGVGLGHVGGGHMAGIGIGGISANKASSAYGQSLGASSGYLTGNTNTEIEQTESNKQSQSEKNSSSNNAYEAGGSNFALAGQQAVAQNLETEKKQASLIAF